jgi:hypothetical protein
MILGKSHPDIIGAQPAIFSDLPVVVTGRADSQKTGKKT